MALFSAWKRKKEDEIIQAITLYKSLVDAKKITAKEYKKCLKKSATKEEDLLEEEAVRRFIKSRNESFWSKVNQHGHSLLVLAKQICEQTLQVGASATYLKTGIPVSNGKVVCLGTVIGNEYSIPSFNQTKRYVHTLDVKEIFEFLNKYAKYAKDPLMMIGIWQFEGNWQLSLCHNVGSYQPNEFDKSYYDVDNRKIIYLEKR